MMTFPVIIDTVNPTVTVNIVDSSLDEANNTSTVTFEFSEDVTGFTIADVTPENGELSSFSGADDSYSATFTADDPVDATGSVIVGTGYTDLATNGNGGSGGSDTVIIDTENPTVTVNICLLYTSPSPRD